MDSSDGVWMRDWNGTCMHLYPSTLPGRVAGRVKSRIPGKKPVETRTTNMERVGELGALNSKLQIEIVYNRLWIILTLYLMVTLIGLMQ